MSPPKAKTNIEAEESEKMGTWSVQGVLNICLLLGILCGGTWSYAVSQEKLGTHSKNWEKQEKTNKKFEQLFVEHDDRMDLDDLEDKLEEKDIKMMAQDLSDIKKMFKEFMEMQNKEK